MTESPDIPQAPSPPAAHRVGRRRIVALAVAAVMLLGIAGLVVVALVGGDSTPTGEGLQAPIDVGAPATATDRPVPDGSAPADSTPDDAAPPAAAAAPAPPDDASQSLTGDDFDVDSSTAPADSTPDDSAPAGPGGTAGSMGVLPEDAELPEPSEPVQLPVLIVPPAPASSLAVMTLAEFDPSAVEELAAWDLTTREDEYLELTDGSTVIEVFVLDGSPTTADEALDQFFAGIDADVDQLDESSATRLPAPEARFVSVSGAQFTAVDAQQQGTRTITGSAIAGIDGDGRAIVVVASRPGTSSLTQRTDDGEHIATVLAHVTP